MTESQISQIVITCLYSVLFFSIPLGLLTNAFFLYDEAVFDICYAHNTDMGWLKLLVIPVEVIVASASFSVLAPYILW